MFIRLDMGGGANKVRMGVNQTKRPLTQSPPKGSMQTKIQSSTVPSLIKLALILGLSFSVSQRSSALSILDSASFSGHNYYLLDTSNWTAAENQASLLGGHLVTINDAAENSWLSGQWGAGRSLWLGLNDAAVEGTFQWASGQSVTYVNWNVNEPNNGVFGPQEDYVYMISTTMTGSGKWNDYQDNNAPGGNPVTYGVVEVVPEPSSAALLAGGLACFMAYRRRSGSR
jgi:hypothetical protein